VENLISKGFASGLKAGNRAAQWNAPGRFLGIQAGTLFNRLLGSNLFESGNSKSALLECPTPETTWSTGRNHRQGIPPIWLGSRMVRVLLHKIYKG
jgi:hypothetical protein